jgi:hypothetical protein
LAERAGFEYPHFLAGNPTFAILAERAPTLHENATLAQFEVRSSSNVSCSLHHAVCSTEMKAVLRMAMRVGARDRAVALGTVTRPPVTEMHRGFKKHIVYMRPRFSLRRLSTYGLSPGRRSAKAVLHESWVSKTSAKRLAHSRATYLPCAKRPE